jgi:predicted enzyme related to lactoylglutathione lyase
MGHAVVHFEIEGRDGDALRSFYSDLFGWEIDANNPMDYGLLQREGNTNAEGVGIGGAVLGVPETPSSTWRGPSRAEGYGGHVTLYVEVPDVEAALAKAEMLGGTRMQGPDEVLGGLTMAKFNDPEGHLIGLVSPPPGTSG